MSTKGQLFLILDGHQFDRRNTFKSRIYWACTQRAASKCKARVTQDAVTNRLESKVDVVHNHEIIKGRRAQGERSFCVGELRLTLSFSGDKQRSKEQSKDSKL